MDRKQAIIAAVIVILIIAVAAFAYISANSHNTKIEVTSNGTLKNGDFLSIRLTDEYRNAFPNEVVDIKILDDSGWAHKYQVTTDDSGEASVELLTFENGNYTVHCNYNGTMFNKQSHSVTNLAIDDGFN
ncbi:MAG: hypothetical protein U0L42_05735 [Methanobrevibacter sp.]|uniref:hypothetical protein n=1 Tax=Methanobrevibacter sp. TaxID=66852 RepID=UPI0025EDFCD8|nr:hypothetical protein [Methanobrevibacter sp.]MEE0935155.1 hypothetical protein [Methanobrevibacter sp.]